MKKSIGALVISALMAISTDAGHIHLDTSIHKGTYVSSDTTFSFPFSFGGRGVGKEHLGDRKTPKGDYLIINKWTSQRYDTFFLVNYPNKRDAKRGLDQGLVSKKQHDSICDAIDEGRTPNQHTKLGGYIGMHGPYPLYKYGFDILGTQIDWTDGCLVIEDDVLEFFKQENLPIDVTIE